MGTQRRLATLWAWLGLIIFLQGCDKKCQQDAEPLRSFVDQEFRIAESSDPAVKKFLTNTTFRIIVFKMNYTGEVYHVEDNERYDSPVRLFKYNVDPNRKLLRIQYYLPPSGEEGDADGDGFGEPEGTVKTYQYALSNQMKMVDTSSGFNYRLVRLITNVRPDEVCKF